MEHPYPTLYVKNARALAWSGWQEIEGDLPNWFAICCNHYDEIRAEVTD